MSAGGITAEPPVAAAPLPSGEPGRLGRYLVGALFLAPALFMLGVWMVYPAIYTIIRSFFGQTGFIGTWVGIDNYKTLFTTHTLLTAIKNNAICVAGVPAFVAGVTWRIMYQQAPSVGAINALSKTVSGVFSPAGVLSSASPSTPALQATSSGALVLKTSAHP